jgi:outer membrane protein assembly factor BamB
VGWRCYKSYRNLLCLSVKIYIRDSPIKQRRMHMRKVAVLFVLALLVGCCFVSGVSNPIEKDAFNKTDIVSTEGLMNSAWPMFHHDTRHTGRSLYGPTGNWPVVKWRFWMDGRTVSSPAIDENGIIYIGAEDFQDSFFALNPDGSEKWRFTTGEWVDSSPAISSDGTIYFGSNNGNLYALYPNGTIKWCIYIGEGWVVSSPVIDSQGIIYVASVISSKLCAVYPNGSIKWEFYMQDWVYCSPALGDDGTIYIGSNDGNMYAVYPNGTLKWKFNAGGDTIGSAPSIADDGTIYFGGTSGHLYALYPNGTLRWSVGTGYIGGSSPAIGVDGTIYVGDQAHNRIYSIDDHGTLNWYYTTNGQIISSPAIDNNGIIFCGSTDGYLYALNPNGTLRWRFDAGDNIESSVAIGADGTIYIAGQFDPSGGNSSYAYLYALQIVDSQPPSTPTIDGPPSGKTGRTYRYTVLSTDPDGDDISYYVDWDDGTNTGWIGPYNSGEEQTVSHTWNKKGTYTIQAKAKDGNGVESDWGTLSVTMPTKSNIIDSPFLKLLEQFFERHPFAFPIPRYLLIR